MNRSINWETLVDVCKHNDNGECSDEDNIAGTCECPECPVWTDLDTAEIEV